jgi:hypothetical protein
MEKEVRKLRARLAQRESGRGRRFSPELRSQICAVGRRLREGGTSWLGIGRELGLPAATVRRLCERGTPSFAPVEVVSDTATAGLVVVAPSGYRVEGLDVDAVAALLARLT